MWRLLTLEPGCWKKCDREADSFGSFLTNTTMHDVSSQVQTAAGWLQGLTEKHAVSKGQVSVLQNEKVRTLCWEQCRWVLNH